MNIFYLVLCSCWVFCMKITVGSEMACAARKKLFGLNDLAVYEQIRQKMSMTENEFANFLKFNWKKC